MSTNTLRLAEHAMTATGDEKQLDFTKLAVADGSRILQVYIKFPIKRSVVFVVVNT